MGKRIISVLLVLVMLVGMLPVTAWATGTTVASGICGQYLRWMLDSEGTLTISGGGAMYDYQKREDRQWESWEIRNKITSVVIHDGVSSIGAWAFASCDNLTSITIPDSVTSIGTKAFTGCDNLTSITIPDSVTSIGDNAFYYCTGLTSIEIPDSVTSIGDNAFYHCTGLTSIEIPDSVRSIGVGVFVRCSGLTAISVDPDNMYYSSDENGVLYNKDKTLLVQVPGAVSGKYTISDSVAVIGDYALAYCGNLTSITIPEGVTSIGNRTFNYCRKLTGVTIPDGVTTIGDYAFQYCDSLTRVTIPDSVTTIGDFVFENCTRLKSVTIPVGVTTIGDHAFNQCHGLASVTLPDGVTTIGRSAFQYCYSLTNVTIPDSVTTIDIAAFEHCESLTSITIPDSVSIIAPSAFCGCIRLKSVTIPNSVTTISTSAFQSCESLTSITIPDGVTTIGYRAFHDCTSLKSVTIPDSVVTIDDYAFNYCDRLTSVTIPDSITTIGDYAFRNCSRLVSVTFCGDAPGIEDNAFKNVTATAYYPANNPTWTEKVRQNYGGNLTWVSEQADLTPDDEGVIRFDSFEQLKQIAATNYDVMVIAKYVGMNPLIISEDLTIPYYMILNLDDCEKVMVPENVTFTVQCQLLVDRLEVNGTMNTQAMFNVDSELTVNGSLSVFEIRAKSDTIVNGRENITFVNEYGRLYRHYNVVNEDLLRNAASDAATSNDEREIFSLYINPNKTIVLNESLTIPAKCEVQLADAGMTVAQGATLTVDSDFFDLYALLTVEGTLRNNTEIGNMYDYDGRLIFAEGHRYVGDGVLRIYSEVLSGPQEAVSGLALSQFHVERKEGSWQPYWELKLNHAARLEDIVNDEHKSHKEKVDDVRDMDAEELKHSMEKDKHVRDMIENLEKDAAGGKAGKEVRHEIPGVDHEAIIIVGANLNSKENAAEEIKLVIDKVEEVREITGNYETSNAVQFSMTLENVKDSKNLEVPVVVTLPVPDGLDPAKIVILHYHDDGTYDVITPEVSVVGGKTYAQFVLTSFSDFAILEKLAALLGDIDNTDDVNVDDVLALLWHVLFPDEYPIGDTAADFDGSGDVNVDDVLALLWHVLFPEEYPLG